MRIIVTGSNGLVGSRLARQLEHAGHSVLGLSRTAPASGGPKLFTAVDLVEAAGVRAAFEAFTPEAVIHTASMTEVDACETAPERAYAANVVAAANVAQASRAAGAHLVHVSTDYVFDGDRGGYGEEDVPNPRGVYATTKHMGEEAVRVLAGSWTVARTAVVYGWPQAAKPNFGVWLVNALSKGQQVRMFEDQVVSPSLADNVAEMLGELAVRKVGGVFHVTGSEAVDRVEFGRRLCAAFGFDPALVLPVRMADMKLASPRPLRSALLTDKVASVLDAKPLTVDQQLKRFREAYLAADATAKVASA